MTPMRMTRKARGLTQADLAQVLGCSQAHVSDVERGTAAASPKLAAEIAKVLGIPEEQILYPERFKNE
ncbi:helix-turn-helix transcriptional regulator [Gulbenkiania mobilis]|uniref:helix-turn-helix transcriptional regulator n=1 Tax=Gulbenkiania mobilis TaxID=397457 RepID=UPI0006BBABAC